MVAGPLCPGGQVGGRDEAMGSCEAVFAFSHPSLQRLEGLLRPSSEQEARRVRRYLQWTR